MNKFKVIVGNKVGAMNFCQVSQDSNGVWTRDLAIPVQRSNQLSYEATNVGSWSFVSSTELIYEMFHILNCGFEIKYAMIIAVMNAI